MTSYFRGGSNWRKSHLTVKGWGSERSQSTKMAVAGFWNHVALTYCWESYASRVRVDDQLCNLITTKRCDQCMGCTVQVQRTIKRAELTDFLCFFTRIIGFTTGLVDHKGIIDGLWRGEMKCIGPKRRTSTC